MEKVNEEYAFLASTGRYVFLLYWIECIFTFVSLPPGRYIENCNYRSYLSYIDGDNSCSINSKD
jgi:hypothetical protein